MLGICALFSAACLVACTTKIEAHPPALGDCVPTNEAGCSVAYGAGAGSGALSGADSASGATPEAAPDAAQDAAADAGGCPMNPLGLTPMNPACLSCLAVPAPTGCCETANACSLDTACTMRVRCATLGSQGLASCTLDTAFTDFVRCLSNQCGSPCNDIEGLLSRDF